MKVEVLAVLGVADGYAVQNYNFIQGLAANDHQVRTEPVHAYGTGLQHHYEAVYQDFGAHELPDLTLMFGTPRFVRILANQGYDPSEVVLYTTWEADRIPEHWEEPVSQFRAVVTTTEFAKEVFEGYGTPVGVAPQPVDTEVYRKDWGPTGEFRFLAVGEWQPRKNFRRLVQTFDERFNGEDAKLLLKTWSMGTLPPSAIHDVIGHDASRDANIQVVAESLPPEKMARLYHYADCLVMPSHGEGFGRPGLEAMRCGTPVITTAWSGPMSYADGDNAWLLDYDLVTCPNFREYDDSMLWADPHPEDLAETMWAAYTDEDLRREKAEAGWESVQEGWGRQECAARLVETIETLTGEDGG